MKNAILCLAVLLLVPGFLAAQEKKNPWVFEADPKLPNVLILGDSISLGYTPFVREALHGKANVYRAMNKNGKDPDNCGNTKMGLKSLDRWLGDTKWDVIHFNWGLWDINRRIPHNQDNTGVRDREKGTISFTPDEYAENLEKIVQRLEKTGAKLIWGSTSLVPAGEGGRAVGDEIQYNAVAAEVMKKHNIPIDDIHALTAKLDAKDFAGPGDVHYKGEGSKKIAKQVVEMIEKALEERKK